MMSNVQPLRERTTPLLCYRR